jgi:DNA repair exonuclease SbcCD ATPase subunit
MQLERKRQALEKSRLYLREKEKSERLNKALEKTASDLEKLHKADQAIRELTTSLDTKRGELKTSEADLEKCRKADKTRTERDTLQKECQDRKDVLTRVRTITEAIEGLKTSLADVPAIPEESVREVLRAENETLALEKAIGQRAMHLQVSFQGKIPYAIATEEGPLSAGEATAGQTVAGVAKKEIRIDLKHLAEIRVTAKDQTLEESLKALKEKKSFLKRKLKQYTCQSVADMETTKARRDDLERELELKEKELTVTLGRETVESVTTQAAELKTRLEELRTAFDKIKTFAVSEEELSNRERETQALMREVQELEGRIRENQGILKSYDRGQLEKEKKDLALEIFKAETALDDLKAFEASGEEVLQKEDEVRSLEQKLSELRVEHETLRHILADNRYGQEDVAELEERIEFLERNAKRLRMKLRAYEIIGKVLVEARQNVLRGISGEVDQRIGSYFAQITDQKYEEVRLSRDDFSLQVYSSDKGDWVNPDTRELSAGARDQLYLAARLALVDVVAGGNSLPLILDDPFVHFDATRRERTRALLREIGKTHQVILLTCHDDYDDWADQIISF